MTHILPPQRQRFEIALDVLKGCTYSCSGCMVDRELYAAADVAKDVLQLTRDMESDGFFAFDLTIGATDFGSAQNVHQIANDPVIGELARRFQTLSITCPMLEKSPEYYERMAENLLSLTQGECFVRIVMPIGPNYMNNVTLMTALQTRLAYLNDLLSGKLHEITFILNMTEELIDKHSFEDVKSIYNWPDFGIMTDMVLNIPHGRQFDIGPKYGPVVQRVSRWMSEFYTWMDADRVVQQDPDLDGITGTHINIGVIGDKAYIIPYLKDEFNVFSKGFSVPKLTYSSVLDTIMRMKRSEDHEWTQIPLDVCDTCEEAVFCREKGIHHIMDELNMTQCPVKYDG